MGKMMPCDIVVSVTKGYFLYLQILLESFSKSNPDFSGCIHILMYDEDDWFLSYLRSCKLPYEIHKRFLGNAVTSKKATTAMLERFSFASDLKRPVMLVDADTIFLGNVNMFFDIAGLGYIVGCGNGKDIEFGFGCKASRFKYGRPFCYPVPSNIPEVGGKCNYRTIALPLFLDPVRYGFLLKDVYDYYFSQDEDRKLAEWVILQALLVKHDLIDKILLLPSHRTSNSYHFMVNPLSGVYKYKERFLSSAGGDVLICHGRVLSGFWWNESMEAMRNFFRLFSDEDWFLQMWKDNAQQLRNIVGSYRRD